MASKNTIGELHVPFPRPYPPHTHAVDVRKEFAAITRRTPRDPVFESAFLANRLYVVRTHPTLSLKQRQRYAAQLQKLMIIQTVRSRRIPPIPGGVGYGMFYNDDFQEDWTDGTSIYFEPICPNPPGGNINTYLYITATNRSARGVEALVSYNGQNQTYLKVYDWARNDHWQTNISFGDLDPKYFIPKQPANGQNYRVLPIQNTTTCIATNRWRNRVYLWDRIAGQPNLIYGFDYTASLGSQQGAWPGSWGPIVETFQNFYNNTKTLGSLNTQVMSRDNGAWGAWQSLQPPDCYLRQDNKGFAQVFLDPNHSWGVNS